MTLFPIVQSGKVDREEDLNQTKPKWTAKKLFSHPPKAASAIQQDLVCPVEGETQDFTVTFSFHLLIGYHLGDIGSRRIQPFQSQWAREKRSLLRAESVEICMSNRDLRRWTTQGKKRESYEKEASEASE